MALACHTLCRVVKILAILLAIDDHFFSTMALPWPSRGPFYLPLSSPNPISTGRPQISTDNKHVLPMFFLIIFWHHRSPMLPLQTLKSGLGTIIEGSGLKNYPRILWETCNISSAVLFYVQSLNIFRSIFGSIILVTFFDVFLALSQDHIWPYIWSDIRTYL